MAIRKHIKNIVNDVLQIGLAIILASIGLKAFLLPNGFLDGGVTGISILISELYGIELSFILPVVTIPFLVLAWYTVSKTIVWKSILAVIVLAIVIHYENFQPITEDKLIISIFGGVFLGSGIGLAIRNGAVLDASEVFGIFINERLGLSIGTVMILFNIVLFSITAVMISIEVALYSILTYLVTGKAIDMIIQGFEDYVGLMIVTDCSPELQKQLIREIGQGMTIYSGLKGYGHQGEKNNMEVIHTVLNRIDSKRAYRIIDEVDENAFVIEFDVNQIKGGVSRKYLSTKKAKKLSPVLYEKLATVTT